TGTSWGTFGVMMPIAIPMAWQVALLQGVDPYIVTYASIASVFAGGIFGDHCSPISDTTIMSSMFSGSDHIDHVNTQLPYTLTAAGISAILFALFASGITLPLILLPIGILLLIVFHRILNVWYAERLKLPKVIPNYTS
ncbi:MAG TPA: Na+/H+ antiporter NhaC family protein, partial [Chromatiaceae bacterium]|nr:Na+/H+ antiporter NhaC family protein [Chromatiaceae bacterium]